MMEAGAIANPGAHEEFRHKNRLQEYAQRAAIDFPVYMTLNEGSQHSPQFRSSVIVDGEKFVSPCAFIKRKEAEQYVAKYAFDSILNKIMHEGVPLIQSDIIFCKSILHEFAAKMKMELPIYTTTSKSEGVVSIFFTSVVFGGKTYIGSAARNKRDAEQFGARTVIEWLLGQSDTSIVMAEIIKSKHKLFNAIPRGRGSIVLQENNIPLKVTVDNRPGDTAALGKDAHIGLIGPQDSNVLVNLPSDDRYGDAVVKEKDMQIASTNDKLLVPATEHSISEVCFGSIGERCIARALQQNDQPEGSTREPLNPISNGSCPEQAIQGKIEVLSEDHSTLTGKEVPSQDPSEDYATLPGKELPSQDPSEDHATLSGNEVPSRDPATLPRKEVPVEDPAMLPSTEVPSQDPATLPRKEVPIEDSAMLPSTEAPIEDLETLSGHLYGPISASSVKRSRKKTKRGRKKARTN